MSSKSEIIFAGAPYSNSAPLVDKLESVDPRARVISDHPVNLVLDLNEGRADAALIPIVHLFNHPELMMLDGLGIAADGPVKSVLLKCSVPIDQIRTVARDPASASSNALAALLLAKHYGREVEMVDTADADAAVVIGDRALCSDAAPAGDIDLAEAWKDMTGLPFVFAVWAIRRDNPNMRAATEIAVSACDAGVKDLENIATRCAAELNCPASFMLEYLGSTIHYKLNERDIEGVVRFKDLLSTRDLDEG